MELTASRRSFSVDIPARPWMYSGSVAGIYATLWMRYNATSWADYFLMMFFGSMTLGVSWGLTFCIAQQAAIRRIREERAAGSPTVEELNTARALVAEAKGRQIVTGGSVNVTVPDMEPIKRELPVAMREHQFVVTTPRLDGTRVRIGLMKFCKQQWIWLDNPELGKPEGDYRETTWVNTNRLTRRELNVYKAILECNHGIARKGSAKSATHVTIDREVIRDAARGVALPHPIPCGCDDCKQPLSE